MGPQAAKETREAAGLTPVSYSILQCFPLQEVRREHCTILRQLLKHFRETRIVVSRIQCIFYKH